MKRKLDSLYVVCGECGCRLSLKNHDIGCGGCGEKYKHDGEYLTRLSTGERRKLEDCSLT